MRAVLCIIVTCTLFSCGPKPDVLAPIMGQEKGHFRGSYIGDEYGKVLKKVAQDNPTASEEGVLNCEFVAEDAEILVRYDFDQDRLYAIQADIFFADTASMSNFQQTLVNHYNTSYGEVDMGGGFLVWRHRNAGIEVEVALADESIEFGQPKLSLTIYNFDN